MNISCIRCLNNLRTIRNISRSSTVIRKHFKSTSSGKDNFEKVAEVEGETEKNVGQLGKKYKVFEDKDSEIIWDVYEQRLQAQEDNVEELEEEKVDVFEGINVERGYSGVYDIEDLIEVLHKENGQQIFVASVPKEIKYVEYIVLVNGKSTRHMQALAEFVRKVYKKKMHQNDLVPRLEGKTSPDWLALDLGNIALHIFSQEARRLYDLDTLWAVGPKFDKEFNKEDPVTEMLEKHAMYLKDLQPAS